MRSALTSGSPSTHRQRSSRSPGSPENSTLLIEADGQENKELIGAIVQATGWQPYDATKLGHLGYGKSKDVVTNVELEQQLASTGKLLRPSDGAVPRSVVFVQCAGSRDSDHLPYCSAVCCRASLKQAQLIRELCPDTAVSILYKDMRTPGQYEIFYKNAQEDTGIFLSKGEVSEVTVEDGALSVTMNDSLLGEAVEVGADLVVLATGMTPASSGPILNLTYRQGPELPVGKYDFPDSDFICFPYETKRTGIYAAGCVREPMDSDACAEDAAGASLKAIQCIASTARGAAVHPRAGDLTYPEFFLQRCTQCKRCTEECPFGALDEDEKGTPKPNPGRCRPLRCVHGCLPRAHHLLQKLFGRRNRFDAQVDRSAGRIRREATLRRLHLRERHLPRARPGGVDSQEDLPLGSLHSAQVSGFHQPAMDQRCPHQGHRWRDADRPASRARTTSATSSRAASCVARAWRRSKRR